MLGWATAYRRTRRGVAVWEIRADKLSGCLRTTAGGSSKQAIVEAGKGSLRIRWMTALEYARLQGIPDLNFGGASESQVRFALGDAVCVPAVEWLGRHLVLPLVRARQVVYA
jgi:DNA (cytosine-5)-methyltransferase 1